MLCETATSATFFFPFDLVVIRQNFSFKKQFVLRDAAHAHSLSAPRNHGFPPVVWLLRLFPALRLFPGHTPAHELNCPSDGNCRISGPVSARMFAPLRSFTPGTVCTNSHSRSI